ncbi:hypothetical protein D0Y65_038365 [Glycine soja]|uniref:Cell division control protein 24 OB domain-containing protein n=1 Tax=Glycine soja TaxID=3848 RepID=A0A445H4P8_GLYSO|nr:hypothetical protein D0Y65_038365 [Glycine soja]
MPEQAPGAKLVLIPECFWLFLTPDDPLGGPTFSSDSEECSQCSNELSEEACLEDSLSTQLIERPPKLVFKRGAIIQRESSEGCLTIVSENDWKCFCEEWGGIETKGMSATIDHNFLSLNSVLEAVIIDAFVLPGTNIHMLTLGDYWSSNIIDVYLHRSHSYSLDLIINPPLQKQKQNPRAEKNQRMATMTGVSLSCPRVFFNASGSPQNAHAVKFYDLTGLQNGILKRGREIFLTGCYLRTPTGGSGHSRLLPTEYLVILLDEDFQKEIVKAAKTFTAIGYKHIETGED